MEAGEPTGYSGREGAVRGYGEDSAMTGPGMPGQHLHIMRIEPELIERIWAFSQDAPWRCA
jgi:hypothetical protein